MILWLFAAGLYSCLVLFVVWSLCLTDPVQHYDYLVGEEGAGCLAFLWFVVCVLSAMVCLLFLLVSMVRICDCNYALTSSILFFHKPLRKDAYSNIWKTLPKKTENFRMKSSDIFHISAQKID